MGVGIKEGAAEELLEAMLSKGSLLLREEIATPKLCVCVHACTGMCTCIYVCVYIYNGP